jgi:hypothetical protein
MRILARAHQLPPRWTAGGFILQSGLAHASADEETAGSVHGMAVGTYPFLNRLDPVTFAGLFAKAEIALGAALIVPVVPSLVAGAALTAFAGGLLGLYLRTPGMRRPGTLLPTPQGLQLAKDIWLLGIGVGLVAEELMSD